MQADRLDVSEGIKCNMVIENVERVKLNQVE